MTEFLNHVKTFLNWFQYLSIILVLAWATLNIMIPKIPLITKVISIILVFMFIGSQIAICILWWDHSFIYIVLKAFGARV